MKLINTMAAWLICAAFAMPAWSDDPAPVDAQPEAMEESAAAGDGEETAAEEGAPEMNFQYQTGDIVLPNKVATLHLGDRYRYLNADETSRLLVAWGNESDNSTQGAIIPADVDPMTQEGW